ncbi:MULTISPECIES: NADP-dependent oxidoreductase [unclassified Actinotalea]|uniref:quinone oxidoreductase family protein n=1 Tax=unclassified Actinotalea TaxID=2638618 RepID=UPI0015F55C71|nr:MULTISPECIES: NADP-dependent oxidoreductase [unclassified Actinotalea]
MTRAVVAPRYGGPEVLEVVDVEGGPPGPGQVLLEVRAAGVNPGDWKQYTGVWGTDPDRLPLRLGFEASGVVAAVGPDVPGVRPGDEVIAYPVTGAYAERVLVRATSVLPKPADRSWEKAAGLMVTGVTAFHAIAATRVGAGDTVLVHGAAGGVGSAVVQLAHARGARVVGTASRANWDHLTELHAVPVPYGPGLEDRVRHAAPHGVTAAIDCAGTPEAITTSLALVADRSRIATVAGHAHAAGTGIALLGAGAGSDPGTEVRRRARTELLRLWTDHRIDVRVGARYPLEEATRAHRAGMAGTVDGKIVLHP